MEDRLRHVAPGNTAPLPITAAKEQQDDGSYLWTVDIHVRIPRITEYEVSGRDTSLAGALRRAYLALNNEPHVRKQANIANKNFGIEV